MGVAKKEPIIEIFANETGESIKTFDKYLLEGVLKNTFEKRLITELAKIVHIIRLNSSMLLFEGIANVSGELEKLLDCYRDARAEEPDFEPFKEVVQAYSEFIHNELYKLKRGERVDGNVNEILELIGQMDTGAVGFEKSPTASASKRKQYYISSKTEDGSAPEKLSQGVFDGILLDDAKKSPDGLRAKTPTEIMYSLKNSLVSYDVTDDKMEEIRGLNRDFERAAAELKSLCGNGQADEIVLISQRIDRWITEVRMSDLFMIASKAKLTVADLLKHTGKKANFEVEGLEEDGEPLLIEKYKIANISKILTHLIRNAVDHGIESSEVRKRRGKSEEGCIKLSFAKSDKFKGIELHFSDDGVGIDPNKILKEAEMKGILLNPKENYSIEDVLKIPFMTGFTTRKTVGDYSGRGVGLDAVAHLVGEIKGKVMLASKQGEGTEVTIEFPYDHVSE